MKKIFTLIALSLISLAFTFAQTTYEPNVMVSTLAGSWAIGSADGQGMAASFYNPQGEGIRKI